MQHLVEVVAEMMYCNDCINRQEPFDVDRIVNLIEGTGLDWSAAEAEADLLIEEGMVSEMVDGYEEEQAPLIAKYPNLDKILNAIFEVM